MKRRALLTLVLTAVTLVGLSTDAAAACSTLPGSREALAARAPGAGALAGGFPFAVTPSSQRFNLDRSDSQPGIVGLWFTVFKIGDAVWNRGFQQYHADQTELSVDSSVPPVLGNVCIGVWKVAGPRTFKLRHVTWNWNLDGSPAGTFLLLTTVQVDPHGNTYSGTFESDSFDTDNNVIPEFHAEGTVTGRRITVD
jgi:hypothetical protein